MTDVEVLLVELEEAHEHDVAHLDVESLWRELTAGTLEAR